MSASIDERIVAMKFDNKEFERNAQTSLTTLDKLKEKLNFSDVQDKLGRIDTSSLKKDISSLGDIDSSKLNSVLDRIEYRMSNFGIFTARIVENVADSMYSIVQKALSGVDRIVTYAEQGIVQGGYTRASNIQSAKFQLEGLGIAWKDIYNDIDYAVTNTAYSLDQAAIVASQLASSGVKPGTEWVDKSGKTQDIDEMAMILRSISGTASATGGKADYADIGRIFTKMISYGKVYTQNLNELATYGIGAKGIVADYLNTIGYQGSKNWTESKVQDKMSDRKGGGLDPQLVIEAFYNKFAEHATAANETLSGVMANTRSALARIGETFFEPIIENGGPLVHMFEVLRQSINDVNKAIKPVVKLFGENIADKINKVVDKFLVKETDEEGNVSYHLKETGGIFSSWLQPWKEMEYVKNNLPEGIAPSDQIPEGYWVTYESRAERLANNLRITFNNLWDVFKNIGSGIGDVFHALNPGFKGFADLAVRASNALASATTSLKNFTNDPGFKNSLFFKLLKALGAGIDIIIRFGKSFKLHIIDPIFHKAGEAARASGLTSWFTDLLDKIFEFDMKLKEKGNEDYFGPMLERFKERCGEIKDNVVGFFEDIANWWKPVKDILTNSDLSWGDKFKGVKEYFSENFEVPGWDKVKTVFEKIGSAIDKVVEKIKTFFGFNKKTETSGLTTGVGAGGHISNMNAQLTNVVSIKDFVDSYSDTVDKADTSSDKLSSIGEKIGSFFSNLKSSFSNLDIDALKVTGWAIVAVFVLLAVGIAWTIKKIIDALSGFVIEFPKLMTKIMESFNTLLTSVAGMFKAKKFESYTAGIKNLAVAVSMIAGVLVIVALIVGLIKKFGGDEMIDGLREAEAIIGALIGLLGGMIITITALTRNATGAGVALSKANGLKADLGSSAMSGIAAFLRAFALSIAVIAGAILLLGFVYGREGGKDAIKNGSKLIFEIIGTISGIVAFLLGFSAILGKVPGINDKLAVGSLASIGALLTGFAIALAVIVPSLIILGLIPEDVMQRGIDSLISITATLGMLVIILMTMSTVLSAVGGLKGNTLALTVLGIAAILAGLSLGIVAMTASLYVIGRMSLGEVIQGIAVLTAMSLLLVGIPGVLMLIYSKLGKDNAPFATGMKDGKALTSIAATILSIGAAMVAISIAFRILDKVENTASSFGVLAGLMLGMTGVVWALSKIKEEDLKSVGKVMLIMGGVFAAVGLTLAVLSKFKFDDLIETSLVMFVSIGALAVAIYALSREIGTTDKNAYKNLADFAKAMMYVGIALLPLSMALAIILGVVGALRVDPLSAAVALGGFAILILAVSAAVKVMAESANQNAVKKNSGLVAYTNALMKLSFALIPVAIAAAALIAVVSATGINGLVAVGLMATLAAVIFAMGAAMGLMIEAVAQVKNDKMIKATSGLVLSMAIALLGIGGAVGIAVLAITGSGIDAGRLAIAGVIIGAMMAFVYLMSKFMLNAIKDMRWNKGSSIKKVVTVLGTYATVCLGLYAMAGALKKLGNVAKGNIVAAGIVLSVMAGVVTLITIVLTRMEGFPVRSLSNMATFLGVCAGLVIIAKALQMLSTFKFAAIRDNLMAMGAVVLVALAITALFGVFASLNTAAALATAGMLLGLGVTMAGVGIMLYLFAHALDTFLDVMIEVDGKSQKIRGGVGSTLTGLVDGLTDALKHVNSILDSDILPELTKFFDSLFGWLETEIPTRFQSVLNVIKDALISISDFVNDPEVKDSIVGIINGILDILLENAEDWSSKVVQIGVKIGAGICDGINQAFFGGELTGFDDFLYNLGENIDKYLLGGSIDKVTTWVVDTFGSGEGSGIYDSMGDLIHEATVDFREKVEDEFYSAIKSMGLNVSQVKKLIAGTPEVIEWLQHQFDILVQGMMFNNPEAIAAINGKGGWMAYISEAASMIKEYFGLKNMADMMGEDLLITQLGEADKMYNQLVAGMDRNGFVYDNLKNAYGLLRQAAVEGWNDPSTQTLKDLAVEEINAALAACNDPEKRELIYEYARLLGIELPTGFEDGTEGKDTERTISDFMRRRIFNPLRKWFTPATTYTASLGAIMRQSILSSFTGEEQESGNEKGIKGFAKVLLDTYSNLVNTNSTESKKAPIAMQGHFVNMSSTMGLGLASVLTPEMVLAGNKSWAAFQAVNAALAMIPQTYRPNVNYIPNVTVSSVSIPEGVINTMGGIFQAKLKAAFGSSGNFTYTGEMITGGILNGMVDAKAQSKMSSTATSFLLTLANAIKKRFGIHSPATAKEVVEPGEQTSAGFMNSMVGYFKNNIDDASDQMATDTGDSLDSAFNNVDLSSVGSKVSNALTSKLPSWDSLKSNFGWEKGISGNIEGLKNAWNQIKNAFNDENGNFDVASMFGGVGDSLKSVLGGITDSLNLNELGFDPASMGLNFTVDSGFDFGNLESEFATFDINDMVDNNNLEMTLDLNTDMFDEFMKENRTFDMATSTPVYGGYQRSTLGSTYVNNYNYNQTNNSPVALSSREIRRQTELELNRRQRSGGFRPV